MLIHKLVLGVLLALSLTSARAQGIEFGNGLICDTKEQVADYVAKFDGDTQDTLTKVNGDASPPARGIVAIAYIRGATVERVRGKRGTFDITAVLVVAVNIGLGWVHGSPASPAATVCS
jgi:hypothetical protein